MYSQPIYFTHELILCVQITGGRVNFNRDSAMKNPCFEPVTFRPRSSSICHLTHLTGFGHFCGSTQVGPHSSGQYSRGLLCSSRQQAVQNTVLTFPEPVRLERVCRQSDWFTSSLNGARLWVLSGPPGVLKQSTIQVLSRLNVA